MAYSATVTTTRIGNGEWEVEISETECGPTSEATITNMPVVGTVVRQTCIKTAGSAATVDPILGTATDPSDLDVICENDTPSETIDTQGAASWYQDSVSSGTLYHRSRPNTGNDNTIVTRYLIRAGL